MTSLFEQHGDSIAGLIVEPIAGNMGVVLPQPGFLSGLKQLCTAHGAVLIFDEVMTGFRVHPGGAQALYGVEPDLTVLGKVIGGGLPVGAYGGKREIMNCVAPVGSMYQAGTLSGNPIAMAAGIATLSGLTSETWGSLKNTATTLDDGIKTTANRYGIEVALTRAGTMSTIFFCADEPKNWRDVSQTDAGKFKKFFHNMMKQGVFLAPSAYEAAFLSAAHDEDAIQHTLQAIEWSLQRLKDDGMKE